ncbi:MFS transporter [Cellulomonas persica]|uniref:MFS transporter n=1 Tax=Cellulomonas persica TaxID=76861 RepID=A0A510UXM0_9CELL|nr:MFS transporter [Cellulomonas persica]GEK19266.1 MFS transporter [Cellulomonas persica]
MTQRARDTRARTSRTPDDGARVDHGGGTDGRRADLLPDDGSTVAVVRARLLLLGLFALQGIAFSSWLARLPAVRDALDLTPAALGGVLLVGSVGALLTVTVAGIVVQRWGSRAAIVASTVVLALAYVLMGVGPGVGSVALLCVGVFLNGVSIALGNVPINVESARIERAMRRTVIPQFHAAYSIGAVVGSGLGALASRQGVSPAVHFAAVAAVAVVWRLASVRGVVLPQGPSDAPLEVVPATPQHDAATSPVQGDGAAGVVAASRSRRRVGSALDAWREPRTLLIGVVIMAAALSEGSANDWLSIAVVDGFGRTEAVGGAVLALYVAAMTVVRLVGTRMIDRYGRVLVLRVSGVVSIVGLVVFGFAPTFELASLGVVAWGFGAALAVPIGIAAASDDPVRAAGRVAVISSFSSVASIAAPPLLGLAAQSMGARHALVLIAVAMVASVTFAHRTARPTGPDAAAAPTTAQVSVPTGAADVVVDPTVLTPDLPSPRTGAHERTPHEGVRVP